MCQYFVTVNSDCRRKVMQAIDEVEATCGSLVQHKRYSGTGKKLNVPRSRISRSRRSGWGIRSMTLSVTSVRDSKKNDPRASLCTMGNGPNKGVKLFYDGGEGQPTSGQALGVEKQEGNMHYFVCSSPGDIYNQSAASEVKFGGVWIPRTKSVFAPRHFLDQ